MGGADPQSVTNVEESLKKSITRLQVVKRSEVLGDETDLRISDHTVAIVLEGELELGKPVEEFAGYLVRKYGAVAVELRCHPHSRTAEGERVASRDGRALLARR